MATPEEIDTVHKYCMEAEKFLKDSGLFYEHGSVIMPVAEFVVAACYMKVIQKYGFNQERIDGGYDIIMDGIQKMVERLLKDDSDDSAHPPSGD